MLGLTANKKRKPGGSTTSAGARTDMGTCLKKVPDSAITSGTAKKISSSTVVIGSYKIEIEKEPDTKPEKQQDDNTSASTSMGSATK